MSFTKNNITNLPRVNSYIKSNQVRVINADGNQLGIMTTWEAIREAKEQNLDLVEIDPKGSPPVCKIIDFGKYKFQLKKKEKEIARAQKPVEVKQINVRPITAEHDLIVKTNYIKRFLEEGNKVKITVEFRGRETAYSKQGEEVIKKILSFLQGKPFIVEEPIQMAGKQMSILIAPQQ